MVNDTTIEGTWTQGQSLPLTMHREELKEKPQTPLPPFPYKSEEVTFTNKDKSITYGATITAPADGKKHPALLLITGSGQQDRDETILGHKPFLVLADYLTRHGYVVLRVDDRGKGKTSIGPNIYKATSADFADDAEVELDYLKSRPEVNVKKVGLLGHSEGGMIATMLAAKRKDLAFIISWAGPGISGAQTLLTQNDAILRQKGMDSASRVAYLNLYADCMRAALKDSTQQSLAAALEPIVFNWRKVTPEVVVVETTGINDDESQQAFITSFAQQFSLRWLRYFITYDPEPLVRNISCKVFVLNGSKDIQVVPAANLGGWRRMAIQSKSKHFDVLELPGLNHLFQECSRCDVDEYGELDQTISPTALNAIGGWLKKQVDQ
jgi:pimeloyl-ACP methyl ester carboxylesterase